jgi:hypothetical protein
MTISVQAILAFVLLQYLLQNVQVQISDHAFFLWIFFPQLDPGLYHIRHDSQEFHSTSIFPD